VRRALVTAVRRGASQRAVARRFGVGLGTVQRALERAGDQRLDRVDWTDRSHRPHRLRRTASELETQIVELRQELKATSALGEYGAAAIARALEAEGHQPPAVRTINRVLARRGAFDARYRVRRPAPPPGWYLPRVAAGLAELDSWDFVEGLVLQGGPDVEVLNVIALRSGWIGSWPDVPYTAVRTLDVMLSHWRQVGLPDFAQFDNDTRFQGAHQHRDVISRVTRLCLHLGVTPVFTVPREHGFQNRLENLNGRWQVKVWGRFHHNSLAALQARSIAYVQAARARLAARTEGMPDRRPIPSGFALDLQAPLYGQIIFLRRTTESGSVELLQRRFLVDAAWPHRLVRCEVDLDAHCIRFYRLRRRAPAEQPLVAEIPYQLPRRRFKE
jgi:transposase